MESKKTALDLFSDIDIDYLQGIILVISRTKKQRNGFKTETKNIKKKIFRKSVYILYNNLIYNIKELIESTDIGVAGIKRVQTNKKR